MNKLLLLTLVAAQCSCIDLILPFEGDPSLFSITNAIVIIPSNGTNCIPNVIMYNSATEDVIRRVVYKGVELFKDEAAQPERRHVYVTVDTDYTIVLVMPEDYQRPYEALFLIKMNSVFDLTRMRPILSKIQSQCPEGYFEEVKEAIYSMIPTMGLIFHDNMPTLRSRNLGFRQRDIICDNKREQVRRVLLRMRIGTVV